ncbi:MAG: carotenoid biosynthesis protein [Bacteroidota bacterium]
MTQLQEWLSQHKVGVSIFLVWLFNISGIIGISAGYGDWFLPKTPITLGLNFVLLLWNFPPKNTKVFLLWFAAFAIGMFVEIIGVKYGFLFGEYYYGENLGIKIMGVPILIGINWAVLTFMTSVISHHLFKGHWAYLLVAAFLMVFLDFFIEPNAPVFDFWYWPNGHAPLRNYIAWYVIAFLLHVMVRKEVAEKDYKVPLHIFVTQLVFFAVFYLINHH